MGKALNLMTLQNCNFLICPKIECQYGFSKISGAEDPRCPIGGLEIPKSKACKAYASATVVDHFEVRT